MSKIYGVTVGTPLNPNKIGGGGGSGADLDILTEVAPTENHTNEQVYGAKALDEVFLDFAESLDVLSNYEHITNITEYTYIYELDDGIYHVEENTGAAIYFDDVNQDGLQDGLLLVSRAEYNGSFDWVAVGRSCNWDMGTFTGHTELSVEGWVSTHSIAEKEGHKASEINDETNDYEYYPSVRAVVDYVRSWLETKQNTLVSGENIKTINGESILGSGNIFVAGGGAGRWWETLDEVTLEEDAVPYLDLGEKFPAFRKIRITATLPTMEESKSLGFFFTNIDVSIKGGYGNAYQVGTYTGTGGKLHYIEFEPVIVEGYEFLLVESCTLGTALNHTVNYSAYDHSRILTARYFFSQQVFPAGSRIKLEGIKI